MKKSTTAAIAAAILVVIIGIVVASRSASNNSSQGGPSSTPVPKPSTAVNPNSPAPSGSAVVKYTLSGFDPGTSVVRSGHTITINNTTAEAIQVDSDPHPQHTDNTELNIGEIGPGASKTVTLRKTGTWKYHNHLDETKQGSVSVE